MPTHRLMIVEDHETTRRLLRAIFSRTGWEVTEAGTVAEGLTLLETGPAPCCLILDIDLPDGSGLESLQAIHKARIETRGVVLSATRDAGTLAAFAAYDAELILPKPLDPALPPIGLVGEG